MLKKDLRQISINEISMPLPDLKNNNDAKAVTISKWIMNLIDEGLRSGKIEYENLLPSKAEFAFFLSVSIGTIQNALRLVEDAGYTESKQCIGTLVKDRNSTSKIRKLTSKREITTEKLKKFIKSNHFKTGDKLPSSRIISKEISSSLNTTRLALETLCSEGILKRNTENPNNSLWSLKSLNFKTSKSTEQETLVDKIEQDLKNYITENLSTGSKMPSHGELASMLNASIKTIHDALKNLTEEGIIMPRRGRYGTSVIKMPSDKILDAERETSIFAPARETAFYYYERTQNLIKKIIVENYSIGDRLPSIMQLSREMDLSSNTIRKAFQNLAKEGYLTFSRGRYGGTFVSDIPQTETQSFKWLAVNPSYTKNYN